MKKNIFIFVFAFMLFINAVPVVHAHAAEDEYFTITQIEQFYGKEFPIDVTDNMKYCILNIETLTTKVTYIVIGLSCQPFFYTLNVLDGDTIKYDFYIGNNSDIVMYKIKHNSDANTYSYSKVTNTTATNYFEYTIAVKMADDTYNYVYDVDLVYSNYELAQSLTDDDNINLHIDLSEEDFVFVNDVYMSLYGINPPDPTPSPTPVSEISEKVGNGDFIEMIPVILSLFLVFPLNVFLCAFLIVLGVCLYRKLKKS